MELNNKAKVVVELTFDEWEDLKNGTKTIKDYSTAELITELASRAKLRHFDRIIDSFGPIGDPIRQERSTTVIEGQLEYDDHNHPMKMEFVVKERY